MQTISQMMKPRINVFSDASREDVLNLTDFSEDRIDGEKFFSETFPTQGMRMLIDTAFARFKGESDTGVIKLTQAMGGGKTHNMLALALLAQNPHIRDTFLGEEYSDLGEIRVVTFSGRENADYGIWGVIAEQVGKADFFNAYYSPLKAPGESAWVELLKGQKILILLDELPPYLVNAKSITVGNSDLSRVTTTALANLFTALGKEQLANVCLVFSDLNATYYQDGSEMIQGHFPELEAEANRVSMGITPVVINSDEIYHILRKRLFEDPEGFDYNSNINDVARSYKESVVISKRSGFTNYSPEAVFTGIKDSYPFHPSLKDLHSRFKENPNFQQTRGLIRLMRLIVRQFYEKGLADKKFLIDVFDFDLNGHKMLSMIRQINPSLEQAINHDIAQEGKSIAEQIDSEISELSEVAVNTAKLILISSLATTPMAVLGLTDQEISGYLSAPDVDLNIVKAALDELKTRCWYIKQDNRGRWYFQNIRNMVAEIYTLIDSYTNENARKELRGILKQNFDPRMKSCYELLYALPAIDEIELDQSKISLVVFEPFAGNELHPELKRFYIESPMKNRVMFLSGQRNMMEKLYDNSKRLKAIEHIVKNMKEEGVPSTDQQFKEAEVLKDKYMQALLSTIRETFVSLYYPTKNGIESAEFRLEFTDNRFDGEEQIIDTLIDNDKYERLIQDDEGLEVLRKKCEQRLFTLKEMPYSQLMERAAITTIWQWFHPDQLEVLRKECLRKDRWRVNGGYLVKGPFEKDPTQVTVEQLTYSPNNAEFTLRVHGIGGNVFYDVGSDPTVASSQLNDTIMSTKEPLLRFICIDPTGERETGKVEEFIGQVKLKREFRNTPNGIALSLESHPEYEIRYTTDGSDPKLSGGQYHSEFIVPKGSRFVRVVTYYGDRLIDTEDITVEDGQDIEAPLINASKPLSYRYKVKQKKDDTKESYDEIILLSKLEGVLVKGASVTIYEKENTRNYVEFNAQLPFWAGDLSALIDLLRETSFKEKDVIVKFEYKELTFTSGQLFIEWTDQNKLDLNKLRKDGEIIQ